MNMRSGASTFVLLVATLGGCSSSSRPGQLPDEGAGAGGAGGDDAGDDSSGGNGGAGKGGGGKGGGAGTDGGTDAGTDAGDASDDGGGDAGPPAFCTNLDPTAVYLLGNIAEGDGTDAIATFDHPESPCISITTHDEFMTTIRPNGSVVWKHWNDNKLWVYSPDVFDWDSSSKYASQPANPETNDAPVDAPECFGDATFTGVDRFLVSPDDGSLLYQCTNDSVWHASGTATAPVTGTELLAIGHAGLLLAKFTPTSTGPAVIDSTPTEWSVQGADLSLAVAVRAASDGFLVAADAPSSGPRQLWHVDATGQATLLGDYPDFPASATPASGARLDGAGNLYEFGQDATDPVVDLVVKRPIGGGVSTVVYTEKGLPQNDWSTYPPKVYVHIHISGMLSGG